MNYAEFKTTYHWMLKRFPHTMNLYDYTNTALGKIKITNYEKHGKRFMKTEEKTEEFTGRFYCNGVDAIPFFKMLGGKESVARAWVHGFGDIPVKITSTSPDGTKRTVREFKFY